MKIYLRKMGFEVDGTGSESCPVTGFVVGTVEYPGSASGKEVNMKRISLYTYNGFVKLKLVKTILRKPTASVSMCQCNRNKCALYVIYRGQAS
jgi:hypothetical protein